MHPPREPEDEAGRLEALRSHGALAATRDEAFDALVRVASTVCEAPIAFIALVDARRLWFLSAVGLDGETEATREASFCGHAILGTEIMVVEDATRDARFVDNPLVVGAPNIRFYAGCPLVDRAGFALGTLSVLDRVPKTLAPHQASVLRELSTVVVRMLEARRADDALSAAERSARSARTDLSVVLDAVAGTVGYWDKHQINRFANRGYSAMFGWTGAEVVGLHLRELLGERLYALNLPYVEAALRGERVRVERSGVNPAGRRLHWVTTYTPDVRDGRVEGFIATTTDETELRDALLMSQRRTELLQLAEEHALVGHWRVEVAKQQLFWSPQVYRIHGVDPATFVPTLANALDAYHPDDREKVRLLVGRALQRREPFEFELRIVRADGRIRLVHSKGRCEIDPSSGRTAAIFGIFQDITEREALRERAVRQERLVTTGTLAAGVGHEINNPLVYVGANIEFAINELRPLTGQIPAGLLGEVIGVLDEARDGAERIGKIVRGLRAFAREDAPSAPTDVRAAIEIALNMAMHELRGRATVIRELGDVPLVLGDESRLSQVFVNLLVNAAQALPTGDVTRNRVVVRTMRLAGDRVAIEVEDNGPGITADVLPRIFDPFFTTKSVGQGSGLGLSICHGIVASLGGDIACTTEVGKGALFRVVIPALVSPRRATASGPAESPGAAGARVLVVDDEEAVARAIVRLLRPDHVVTTFVDPREALRAIEGGAAFDVVFCDLTMPWLTGMDLYRQVRATRPSLAERFVFITGGSIDEAVRAFLDEVPNECLEKPFGKDRLRATARRFAAAGASQP